MVQKTVDERTSDDLPAGLEAPTVADLGIEGGVETVLADLIAKGDYNPGAAPGESLFDQQGTTIRQGRRRNSLATYQGRSLPERVKVYDRQGRVSLVDTGRLRYHLSKPGPDGRPVFFSAPPPDTLPEKYIQETCEICLERGVRKHFVKKADWRIHHVRLHPDEWDAMQEDKEDERRRQDQALLLKAIGPGVKDNGVTGSTAEAVTVTCLDCGWTKASENPEASLRLHKRLHCSHKE